MDRINIFRQLARGLQTSVFVPILYSTIASLGLIVALWRNADILIDKRAQNNTLKKFDFIVVGAGSAGCVVANRLSAKYNVLLLEAGGEPHPLQNIPGFTTFLRNYPELDWAHLSVPQKRGSLNSVNQQSSWSAGKGLGGSGGINFMIYTRGSPLDYDNWANITQDSSWSYNSVLPYFKRSEKYGDSNGDPRYHGFDGEMNIQLPSFTGIADEFLDAGRELGYPEIDANIPHEEGFFKLYHNTENGVRDSPYRAFIQPINKRKSLAVRKYSLVHKILFKDGNDKAYGVEYERHGKTERAFATKEVIISAGVITTPKLLMLSGIGPSEPLQRQGIQVKHNLPVGKNLQDHLSVYLGPFFINQPKTTFLDRDIDPEAFVSWFSTGSGHLSSSGVHVSAVFSSQYAKDRGEAKWPDLQLFVFGFSAHSTFYETIARSFNVKEDELKRYYKNAVNKESFTVVISGARPYSRGDTQLGGSSPYDMPLINPNYLDDPNDLDVKVLLDGVKMTLRLFENTTTMQGLGASFTKESLPGCEHLPFRSDAYWICYIRRYTITINQACGTAAMGPLGSPNAVLDSELRVQGVRNLRVIDASVMPVVPVTSIQAGTMMIAEKGADMILRQWNNKLS